MGIAGSSIDEHNGSVNIDEELLEEPRRRRRASPANRQANRGKIIGGIGNASDDRPEMAILPDHRGGKWPVRVARGEAMRRGRVL